MTIPTNFFDNLEFVHPKDIVDIFSANDRPSPGFRWIFKNELRPIDLYCYFGSRFGQPNGIQNFLRGDHSDNLIHWEWFLRTDGGFLTIQGMNFRTEIWISGNGIVADDIENLLRS